MTVAERFRNKYDRLFIGGEWVEAHSGRKIASVDPATENVWAEVAEADEVDIDRAVKAAQEAFRGPWSKLTASERGALLRRLGDLVLEEAETLAAIETMDNGKPYRDTLNEIKRSAQWFYYYAGAADKLHGDNLPISPNAHAYTRREPIGVVGVITPWNSPVSMYSWKLGPALATGNTVVLKPAELTPVSALYLAELIQKAGFPAGVVNVVPGYGPTAGQALVAHTGVGKIAFTGEHTTAQHIMKTASVNLKRLTFECGGKSPHIIFEDADLEKALIVACHAAFRSTGQSCSLGSRLFLQESIYDKFVEKLVEKASRIRVGMPMDPKTHIGPHTSAEQLAKTMNYIRIGQEEGFKLALGGKRPANFEKGYFVEPTIFTHVDNKSRLAQEEIFGPVLSVIPFKTEEEVVEMANDVKYGLAAGLWTQNVSRAHRVAAQIESGLVAVNTYRPVHWMLPYGGYKISGIGRENGLEVLHEYTEVKTVYIDLAPAPSDPFAE